MVHLAKLLLDVHGWRARTRWPGVSAPQAVARDAGV